MPILSIIFLLLTLGNISFPGTISFLGEFFIVYGFFFKNFILTIIVVFGLILGAIYALWLYNKLFFGQIIRFKLVNSMSPLGCNHLKTVFTRLWTNNFIDVTLREFLIFIPLIFFIFILGIDPYFAINTYFYNFLSTFYFNFIQF